MRLFMNRFFARPLRGATALAVGLAILLGAATPHAVLAAPTLYLIGSGNFQALSGLYSIDVATGASTFLAPILVPGDDPQLAGGGIAYDPILHKLYATGASYSSVSTLYLIDPTTGTGTTIGPSGGSIFLNFGGLAFDAVARKLYATGQDNTTGQHTGLYDVNLTTGAATLIASTLQPGAYLYGLGYDAVTGILYANGFAGLAATMSSLFTLSTASGTETPIGPHGVDVGRQLYYSGIAFHPATHVCYSYGSAPSSQNGLYILNTATGAATLVGIMGPGVGSDGGLAFVPDPASSIEASVSLPFAFAAGPNPFTQATTFSYALGAPAQVALRVFDLAGRAVATIADGPQSAGLHQATWETRDAGRETTAAGVYFVRLEVDGRAETLKVIRASK